MTRRGITAVVVWIVLLGLGAAVAAGLSAALGVRTERVDAPREVLSVAPRAEPVTTSLSEIDVPDGRAVALAARSLRNEVGPPRGDISLRVTAGDDPDSQTYRIARAGDTVRIDADGPAGATTALYQLADRARTGRDLWSDVGTTVTPALPFRMVDLGAVGVNTDAAAWRDGTDYSHASRAFEDILMEDAPYVDAEALAVARDEFDQYLEHIVASGYNAIAFPGLVEYLTFDRVGDGAQVYDRDDEHVARATALREAFAPFWRHAHDLGVRIYLRTDMLALTTPLQRYFDDRGLTTEDPELWQTYASGLDELYDAVPQIDGVLIRIGEAGDVYDVDGWDVYSQLSVTGVEAVRSMLSTLVDQAEDSGRDVIFRTWSVGIGAVGDMHTNPDSYREVLDGIDSEHLIISTKYTLGDFYSHLPFNDTLEIGTQRRIVELQSRREFEGSGSLPNDLTVAYSQALRRFIAANPRVEGIWTWTQDGGPWRAGPRSLELKTGFWQLYELNTYAAARLAIDPSSDPARITADWARTYLSQDPETVRAIGEAMALSRDAVVAGLYIGPYAEHRVFALGLEPPPMMWIFEWDILTGDSAALDVIYAVSNGRIDDAIDEGRRAVALAEQMHTLIADTDPDTWASAEARERFLAALSYQVDLFDMLADARAMVLRHVQWLDTGSSEAWDRWREARRGFVAAAARHESRYTGDIDLPAYNLTAARLGLDRADRDLPMAWAARAALLMLLAWIGYGLIRRGSTARAHLVSMFAPWRAADLVPKGRTASVALIAVPALTLLTSRGIFSWFAAPSHLVLTLGAWLLFVGAVLALAPSTARRAVLAVVGGVIVMRTLLILAVLSVRGPGYYWLMMWTVPGRRSIYVTMAFALFCWAVVATAWALIPAMGRRRAAAVTITGVGVATFVLAGLISIIGLESALTRWNDELAVLPWGLSRILGITVYLGIPSSLPLIVAGVGVVLTVLGLLLHRRRTPTVRGHSPTPDPRMRRSGLG